MAVGQNPVPLVNIKIGGTWVFIRPKMEAYVMTHGHIGQVLGSSGDPGPRQGRKDDHQNPKQKSGRFLKRAMVEKNGKGINP